MLHRFGRQYLDLVSRLLERFSEPGHPGETPAADDVVHARRLGDDVETALGELPERQRAALWLTAVEGYSYAEVAKQLETSEKSVKALVHRGRSALADRLRRTDGGT